MIGSRAAARRSRNRRRHGRRATAVMVGLVLATGVATSGANGAVGDHLAGRDLDGKTFYGIMEFPNGPGICLDNGAAVNTQPTAAHWVTAPAAAFRLWYLWPDAASLPSDVDAAALAYLLKDDQALPHDNTATGPSRWADLTVPEQNAAAAATYAWWAFAPDGVTPPSIPKPVASFDVATRTVAFANLGLKNSSGTWLDGWRVAYTISGPAEFAGGAKTLTVTSSTGPDTRTAIVTGNGKVALTVSASVPGDQVRVAAAQTSGYQGYVLHPGTTTRPISAQGDPVDVFYDFAVRVSTQTVGRLAAVGDMVADTVTVTAAEGSAWLRDPSSNEYVPVVARGTLYRSRTPFAQSPNPAPGAVLVTEVTATWNGPGMRTVGQTVAADQPGFHMWRWQVLKSDQPDPSFLRADAAHDYWMEAETTSVRWPVRVTSVTGDLNVPQDGYAVDSLSVTGYPADHTGFEGLGGWGADRDTAQVRVYGPVPKAAMAAAGATVPAGTAVHWSKDVPAVNGSLTVGWAESITGFQPGCYVFVYEFAGDDRVAPYASAFDDPAERFCVAGDEKQPWVTTQTDPGPVVEPGQPVTDTVTWGDLDEGDVITISAWVFPVEDRSLAPEDWACDVPADEADWPEPIPAGAHKVTGPQARLGFWRSDVPVSYDRSGYCVAFRETTTDAAGRVSEWRGV
ncbi:MAG: hypothetical protein LBK95_19160, partial [Bifidobacteriaceae bacterium]|nr:hypothetical protein [Bifidobacteriaceae bacterium]